MSPYHSPRRIGLATTESSVDFLPTHASGIYRHRYVFDQMNLCLLLRQIPHPRSGARDGKHDAPLSNGAVLSSCLAHADFLSAFQWEHLPKICGWSVITPASSRFPSTIMQKSFHGLSRHITCPWSKDRLFSVIHWYKLSIKSMTLFQCWLYKTCL